MIPILGVIVGLLIGVFIPYSLPAGYSIYVAVGILAALGNTLLVNSTLGCTWEHFVALGKPSRTYLKTYLKNNKF